MGTLVFVAQGRSWWNRVLLHYTTTVSVMCLSMCICRCTGTVARFWLFVLLFVPSVVGTGEVILGILNRHMSTTCAYPFPLWVIIDGSAALLLVVISLVDISTVQSIKARESPLDLEEELTPAEAWKDRVRRSENLGSYACLGFIVIFIIPLFRLVWVLYGIDILYRAGECLTVPVAGGLCH